MTVTFLLGLMGAEVSSKVLPPSCGWADTDMVPPRGLPSNRRDSLGADSQAFLLATHSPRSPGMFHIQACSRCQSSSE